MDSSQRVGTPNRRYWIAHALGLGLTAATATWGGRLLARQKKNSEPAFIPGIPSSVSRELTLEPLTEDSSIQFLPAVTPPLPRDLGHSAVRPVQPRQWTWLASEAIDLRRTRYEVALAQFVFVFDIDPGQAFYRLESHMGAKNEDWTLLQEGINLFGGPYAEAVKAEIGPDILASANSIRLRIGMMFQQPARYKTDLPPIALRVSSDIAPYRAGTLDLWDRIDSKSKSDRG